MPGFRTSGVRVQMIANFVSMLKDNAFRVRSIRVINEMDTWVWKNGRPDHMAGCHDDSLTCLSMALFVIQFYVIQHDKDKGLSYAMLHSFRVNNLNSKSMTSNLPPTQKPEITSKTFLLSSSSVNKTDNKNHISAMLLLAGF